MRFTSLVLLIFSSLIINAQKVSRNHPPPPTAKDEKQKMKDERCVFKRKYSEQQLLSLFPFNKARRIKLISFEGNAEQETGILHKIYHFDKEGNGKLDSIAIDTSNWKEVVPLGKGNFANLGNLLFNYAPFKISDVGFDWEMLCYQPRNAVVFYDKFDKIISVIEICFECEKMEFFPKNFRLGYDCSTKFELFRKFFLQNGIKYGTMRSDQSN